MPQHATANIYGQGYAHTTSRFTMPNPSSTPHTSGFNGRAYPNPNDNFQALYTTIDYTDPIPLSGSEGPKKAIKGGGGEWEQNKIKITQRNLIYILNQTRYASLQTRLRPRSYRKATSPRNQVRDSNHSGRHNSMYERSWVKLWRPKSDELTHTHFIEHLMCVTKKSRAKHKKNEENSSIWSGDSRIRPASPASIHTQTKLPSATGK
jgi:hypothetical protein